MLTFLVKTCQCLLLCSVLLGKLEPGYTLGLNTLLSLVGAPTAPGTEEQQPEQLYKVEVIPNSWSILGEGPHWDNDTQSLYFVDIVAAKIHRYAYEEAKVYSCKIEGEEVVGFVIPIEGKQHKFAVGCTRRVLMIDWNGQDEVCKVEKQLYEVQQHQRWSGNRLNDGKCDARGRLYAGTMRYINESLENRDGQFFRFDKNAEVQLLRDNVGISNGMTWSLDRTKMYYIDTSDFELKEYDYNEETGDIANPRVLYDFRSKINTNFSYWPDGMTIDKDGTLFVGVYNGYRVQTIQSDGTENIAISMPCKQITSAAFGGPKLDILFVTTSSKGDEASATAGFLYKVTGLGTQGLLMNKMKLL